MPLPLLVRLPNVYSMATVGLGLSFLFGLRNLLINVDLPLLLLPTNNKNVSLLSVLVCVMASSALVLSSFVVLVVGDDDEC